jgi:two-component system response regulator
MGEFLHGRTVLIIDDEPDLRDIYTRRLKRFGSVVSVAENGSEALSLLSGGAVDFIICDINMPVMNGLIFFETFRKSDVTTPVLFISGHLGKDDLKDKLSGKGLFDSLEKPPSTEAIVNKLRDLDNQRGVSK